MIQEIAVYLIISGALGYTLFNVYQILNPKRMNSGKCAGCASGSCSLSNLNYSSKKR